MKILITGSDGFIGNSLKLYFIKKKYDVYGTVFLRDPLKNEVKIDFRKKEEFEKINEKGFDVIIHTVGIVDQTVSKKLMYQVNAEGTKNLLDWAKENGCGHFIHLSSISVYGLRTLGQNRSEHNTKRYEGIFAIPYMRSKAIAEKYIEQSGLDYTMLRLPAVFGENDTHVTSVILQRLLDNTFFFSYRKDKLVSLLYVKNLGPLIEKLFQTGPLNNVYNYSDFHIAWNKLIQKYVDELKVDFNPKKKSILSFLINCGDKKFSMIFTFSYFGSHFFGDKLKKIIEFNPVYSLEDGIKEAVMAYTNKLNYSSKD